MRIAVIGAGNVGGALGAAWVRAGHQVTFGVREPGAKSSVPGAGASGVKTAIEQAEVIVLAVPYGAAAETVQLVQDWKGKVLIDCTNPLGPGLTLAVGFNTSGGEQIASQA
jgi:8-hydroxy-5-deazaflavin:NADPH oxidoreductase